jgi:hypothetical protein
MRKSRSTNVPQESHAIISQGCLAVSAAEIVGQDQGSLLAESSALKRTPTARAVR